jgi:hypothetical protein
MGAAYEGWARAGVALCVITAACSDANGVGSRSLVGVGADGAVADRRDAATNFNNGHVDANGLGGFGGLDAATEGMIDAGEDPLDEGNACGTGEAAAELTPVNMLVMFDRSGSMLDDDKWVSASAALAAFFENPASADLSVALRFFPHTLPATGCTDDACDPVACAEPLVGIGKLSTDAAPTDTHEAALVGAIGSAVPLNGEGYGTPMHAALDGALRWATAHKTATPNENTVVILVTDGEPNGCDEDIVNIAGLAAAALASSGVPTYAIGLEGSLEDQLNQIAAAGGTTDGIFIGNGANAEQQLLDALNAIRGSTLSCDFPMPTPADATMEVDPSKINVTYTPSLGSAATFAQVPGAGDCGTSSAWYYDDPQAPTRIHLCPTACDAVRADPNPEIKILIGCATCGGLDVDCGDGTPPGIPPVIID